MKDKATTPLHGKVKFGEAMIEKDRILDWVKNPTALNQDDSATIQAILEKYPYFQAARILKALTSQSEEDIRSAAIHCTDRVQLRQLLLAGTVSNGHESNEPDDLHVNTEEVNAFQNLREDDQNEDFSIYAPPQDAPEADDDTDSTSSLYTDEPFQTSPEQDEDNPFEAKEDNTQEMEEDSFKQYETPAAQQSWFSDPALNPHADQQGISDETPENFSSDDQQDDEDPTDEAAKIAESYALPDNYADSDTFDHPREDEPGTIPHPAYDVKNTTEDEIGSVQSWENTSTASPEKEVDEEKPTVTPPPVSEENKEETSQEDDFRKELQASLEELQKTRASYVVEKDDEDGDVIPPAPLATQNGTDTHEDEVDSDFFSSSENDFDEDWKDMKPVESDEENETTYPQKDKGAEDQEEIADASFFGLNDYLSDENDDDDQQLKKK